MPKRPGFRGPLEKQHGRRAQALLKSASQHLYHIYWSLASQLSWKKSPFLTCKILGLILNTLAADDRYPVLNKDNLTIPTQIQLSRKQQTFHNFWLHFWFLAAIWNILKKKMTLLDFVFPKLRTPKTWLDKTLKSPVSEEALTSNMVTVSKHCWNLHHSTFIIFIDHCQGNWVGKSLSYWHAKFWHCLLTHWLSMKSILLLIETS